MRGNMPFPRAREEELLYVLRKILDLRLWPGSLWAALSEDPSKYCVNQPTIGKDIPIPEKPQELVADSVKRSTVAHLFHFYPVLCEISSIPRRSPSDIQGSGDLASLHAKDAKALVEVNGKVAHDKENGKESDLAHLDARKLAQECLKAVGKELGVSR
ncbi:hypothetical protein CPB84DRAFT_1778648 [Gymnopilus junonius]|uniref:Uncharacterized protein n=1 Tax=Gymnopilus junonius TaxID=109634 RepID=A0A9P5NL37_GYMJU|nr:hypothetical protein CPB84DRAFT_1778648 [Gymnopilus junonius]